MTYHKSRLPNRAWLLVVLTIMGACASEGMPVDASGSPPDGARRDANTAFGDAALADSEPLDRNRLDGAPTDEGSRPLDAYTGEGDAQPPDAPPFLVREGFGADTVGGSGGTLYEVATFAELRAAIEAPEPRIIRQITSEGIAVVAPLEVLNPYVTLENLVLYNAPSHGWHTLAIRAHDVIVTNGRFFNPVETQHDVITIGHRSHAVHDVLVERSTIMFGSDESVNTWYETYDVTFAWNVIAYPLNWDMHGYGPLFGASQTGGKDMSFHHNLVTTSRYRNPKANLLGTFQMWNNVIYNCGEDSLTLFEPVADGDFDAIVEGNVFKSGPDTRATEAVSAREHGEIYLVGNQMDGRAIGWVDIEATGAVSQIFTVPPGLPAATVQDASAAYERVLRYAGAHPESRLPIEIEVIGDVRAGRSRVPPGQGWIEHASDVGFVQP